MFCDRMAFSIIKQLRTKRNEGKSILFSYIVLAGYLFGFINKIVMDEINYVIYFYILDFALVLFDIILYYRYRPKDNVMPITA